MSGIDWLASRTSCVHQHLVMLPKCTFHGNTEGKKMESVQHVKIKIDMASQEKKNQAAVAPTGLFVRSHGN